MPGIILETGVQEGATRSLYTHSTNILVGETDDKYPNYMPVFLGATLLIGTSHSCPLPTLTPTPTPFLRTGGLQNRIHQSCKVTAHGLEISIPTKSEA